MVVGVELMAEESSSNRGKKESIASLSNSARQNDDVEDPVKSPPHSPNNSSTRKACYAVLQSWVSKNVVLFPVAVTFFVTWWFIQFVDGFFSPIYERLGIDIFGLGFITSLIFIFFVGIFASSWLGATVFLIGEWFIKRMPFVKHLYSASKQISSAVSPDQNTTAFKEVAIIRHPRVGEYAFGFITSSVVLQRDNGDEELCSVYVPTNHLYIGDVFLVNSKEIIRPNLSIREGIEIIVSVGMSMPQMISPIETITHQNDRIPLTMALSISRRVLRSYASSEYSALSFRAFSPSSAALTGHCYGDRLSSVQSSAPGKMSLDMYRRYCSGILTLNSSEESFPSSLLSSKRVLTPPDRTIGLLEDLVIPVTNFHDEDKGFMVLAGDVFDVPIRKDIIHRVVRWQLAKRQQGTHSTKTISEVSGTGRKPWPQKGTGRARHGTLRGAQFRGGATMHGPKPRSHAIKLNKKVRRLGLKIALSARAAEGKASTLPGPVMSDVLLRLYPLAYLLRRAPFGVLCTQLTPDTNISAWLLFPLSSLLLIFDDLEVPTHKTKNIVNYVNQMENAKKLLLVDGGPITEKLKLATQNLHYVNVLPSIGLNVYSILLHDTLVMSRDAVNRIVERMHTPINR
ncbi:hypothetical protein ACJIZ3_002805 [Penstemon smallii]|uniref:Ribosomal protein L4 n=1 Tax=Penstemon smallii TaxID=265156 RepID=A0ABD3U7F5_9LAMI